MKIIIDVAASMCTHQKGGISYLMDDFLSTLRCMDKRNEYIIFGHFWRDYKEKVKRITLPETENFRIKTLKLPGVAVNFIEEKLKLPFLEHFFRKEKIDIFHAISGDKLPFLKKMKTVLTIHDLAFLTNPSWYKEDFYRHTHSSALRADMIITPSYSTKKDVVKYYGIDSKKIKVIYWGINPKVFHIKDANSLHIEKKKSKYFFPENYILNVSTSVKRKNVIMLLEAYKNLVKSGLKRNLVIIAGSKVLGDEIDVAIKNFSLNNKVFCYSEVNSKELSLFYNSAECFIFPSLYEGFGFPVLEAMACGCPVITSNVTAMPEIAGDAGILVDPYDEGQISGAIDRILSDSELSNELRQKGLKRVEEFSWERTIKETLSIYEKIAEIS